ncbi:L,D-transpeptidase scaffold domain-containing protein [Falsiroseomonas oryziterrae]|uniref:L,D-transpeptidase family protein n=1 Tax=Falsiroseomonas oryziterrae TaxID=2911368 RepID=UPI001F00CC3E|nr:L,D-transpeptidase family protein [Roseomonas sp. NPKOSM-4]
MSRRSAMASGAFALASAWTLAGCATPAPEPVHLPKPRPEDELTRLRDGTGDPMVAGERLDGALLRRFYARRGFEPVWTTRPAQAEELVDAVLHAGDHGLDPELFQASLLRRRETFPPLRRDLLLSHAILAYADALAHGAVPPDRRRDSEALSADRVDVAAVLDAILDRPAPAGALESLAPPTRDYLALRLALARARAGDGGGVGGGVGGGRGRAAMADRLRTIEVNLERQRWLPRRLPADRVWVNVPDQRLAFFRDDAPVFTTRVVVGDVVERKQSPEFRTKIESSLLNPPWVIPRDIVEADILPRAAREPGFLARHNITLLPNGEAEQAPGPESGLGLVMFEMPNRFDVYLHDTPDKAAFGRENRRLSNGCIRVEKPLELASLLMEKPLGAIHEALAPGATTRKPLPEPVPVFVVYQTAFAGPDGAVQFRPDFYDRDAGIARELQRHQRA